MKVSAKMKVKSLVSVIVPIYKVEQYLDECVESIVNQTYKNLEIILVDDGSPDGCPQMCDEWLRKDGRIKVIHKKNGGLSSARNAGLDVATGEFVCFVDSDDFICLEALQKLHDRFGDDESVGIVSGMIYRYQEGKTSDYNSEWFLKAEKVILGGNFLQETLTQKTSFTVWNKLYRRTLLAGVFFREGRNNEDSLFMYDLGKKICNMNVCMVEIPHYVYYYFLLSLYYMPLIKSITDSLFSSFIPSILSTIAFLFRSCKYTGFSLLLWYL